MSLSEGAYEPPSRDREPRSDELTGPPIGAPEVPGPPEASPPAGGEDIGSRVGQLLEDLVTRESGEFQRVLVAILDEKLADLHDPSRVFMYGVLIGGAVVIVAIVILLALGLLFLHGLDLVRHLP